MIYGASLTACSVEPTAIAPPPRDLGAPMQPVDPNEVFAEAASDDPVEIVLVMPESDDDAARERADAEARKHPRPIAPQPSIYWDGCCNPYGAPAFDFVA